MRCALGEHNASALRVLPGLSRGLYNNLVACMQGSFWPGRYEHCPAAACHLSCDSIKAACFSQSNELVRLHVAFLMTGMLTWACVLTAPPLFCPQGENAWVFVPEDSIPQSVKAYLAFEKDMLAAAKASAPKGTEPKAPTEVSVAVMDGKALTPAEVSRGLFFCGARGRLRPPWWMKGFDIAEPSQASTRLFCVGDGSCVGRVQLCRYL